MGPEIYADSRLSDIEASSNQTQQEKPEQPAFVQASSPFYEVTICGGITLTPGVSSDWDPLFETAAATNRIKYRLATCGGEIAHPWIGPEAFRRYKAAWTCDQPQTITVSLSGTRQDDTSANGYVQIKFNGVLYEYLIDGVPGTTRYMLTLTTARSNQICITTQYTPNTLVFLGQLWDDKASHWVDPRTYTNGYVPV